MGCLFVWYWIVNLIQWRVTLCRSRMMTWVVLVPTVFHETWSSNSYNSPAEFKNSSDHRKRSWCCRELLRGRISFLCFLFVNRIIEPVLLYWCGGMHWLRRFVESSVQFRAEQDSVQVLLSLEFWLPCWSYHRKRSEPSVLNPFSRVFFLEHEYMY